MKVYQDIYSNDEILSDAFNVKQVFDGVGGEVKAKWMKKGDLNIDIGCGNEFGGSEEEAN